jgi:hypothetical protein
MYNILNYNKDYLSPLGEAIHNVLPELIVRNTKLGTRLKSKIKICSLLNDIELRNQNYLKKLIASSDKTLQNLKSGIGLSKAIGLSANKLSQLNKRILNDCFMRKNNLIYNTNKILIKKNKEDESNMLIKKSISILRECISPPAKSDDSGKNKGKFKKYLSESELTNAKSIINNKISADETMIKNKIKDYLDKVKTINIVSTRNNDLYDYKTQKINKEKNKDFHLYAKHFDLNNSDISMIHYQKAKPAPLRDKSCPSIENIKENIFPKLKPGKIDIDNFVNIYNSNGIKLIKGIKMYRKIEHRKNSDMQEEKDSNINIDDDIITDNKKDSFNTLKKIIIRNKSLINKSSKKYDKISSLIDINLPKISEYETIINNNSRKNEEMNINEDKSKDKSKDKKEILNKKIKTKKDIKNQFFNSELMNELKFLKEELNHLIDKKMDIGENYIKNRENLFNMIYNFSDDYNKNNNNTNNTNEDYKIVYGNKKIFSPNPLLRMPSSHSISLIKRKYNNNNIVNNKYHRINKKIRNHSNYTRDKTSASSYKNSISSVFNTSKSENKFKEMFNYINKKNILTNSVEIPSLLSPNKKSYIQLRTNLPTNNYTSISDY